MCLIKEKKLTGKEKLFCFFYAQSRDARGAAAKAGFSVCPERTAAKLLARREVREEINSIAAERETFNDEVRAGYRRLAFGPVTDALRLLFAEEPLSEECMEQLDLMNVSDLKRPKGGGLEIKFFDRIKALEHLSELNQAKTAQEGAVPFYKALERGARALTAAGEEDK